MGSTGRSATTLNNWLFGYGGTFRPQGLVLVAFSKTRAVNLIQLSSNTDSQALEPIWLPTVGSYSRTFLQLSVNRLTKRGEEKREGKRKENKRGRPQTTDPAKGRRGQQKGPQGGEKEEPFR